MLRKAILVDADCRSRVEREVIRLVERDTLRCTIDIHTLHRTVALHDTLADIFMIIRIKVNLFLNKSYLSNICSSVLLVDSHLLYNTAQKKYRLSSGF